MFLLGRMYLVVRFPESGGSIKLAAAACSSKGAGTVHSHYMEGDTIQALMELALLQFGGLGDRSAQAMDGVD